MKLRSQKDLDSLTAYLKANPSLRFWQGLRNWSGWAFVIASDGGGREEDTFYWEETKKP